MIGLKLRIVGAKNFDTVAKRLPKAIARGINEGGDLVRTQVRTTLKVQTGVKLRRSIMERTRESGKGYNRAVPGRLTYAIVAIGKGIPIIEFPVANTGHGIDAKTWGVDHLFQRSFEIAGRGPQGFRARIGPKRFPIRKFYGPSLPKELGKGAVPGVFFGNARALVPPAVLKHVAKALSGAIGAIDTGSRSD